MNTETCQEVFGQDAISDDDLDTLNMILYVKDRYNVSGQAYHEFVKICKQLPQHWKIKKHIKELNNQWNIHPTPEGTHGVQQRLEGRIRIGHSKELKVRSLTGPERLKLFRNIKIKELLPKFNDSEVLDIQILWTELLELNTTFSKRPA